MKHNVKYNILVHYIEAIHGLLVKPVNTRIQVILSILARLTKLS